MAEYDPEFSIYQVVSASQTNTFTSAANPDATEFSPFDVLNVTGDGGTSQVMYVGFSDKGIVVRGVDSGYYLYDIRPHNVGDVLEFVNTQTFPVCFVSGTRLVTSKGHVAIEDLAAGDWVQGSQGWRKVKWIGWRKYGAAAFLTPNSAQRIAPIRIRAHAFAEHIPSSDLLVSPWHHLLVEGMLVRANDLVNGITITQELSATSVDYYHVELEQFDVVMAHGMYSESWADGSNRDFFQNADVASLRPEDKIRRRAPRPGFDHLVLRNGKQLTAIQKRVAQRAADMATVDACAHKAA